MAKNELMTKTLAALKQALFAMEMNRWYWNSCASDDLRRDAYSGVQNSISDIEAQPEQDARSTSDLATLKAEISRLKSELKRANEERDILKKTATYFANLLG
jgi:transposase-like protein